MSNNKHFLETRLEQYTSSMEAARENGDFKSFEYWEREIKAVKQMIELLEKAA